MWLFPPKISCVMTMPPRGVPAGSARYAESVKPSDALSSIFVPMICVLRWKFACDDTAGCAPRVRAGGHGIMKPRMTAARARRMDTRKIAALVREVLVELGEDPAREGLLKT